MAIAETVLMSVITLLLIILVSSLPLYLAVSLLGGKTSIIKTFLVIVVLAVISAVFELLLPFWGVVLTWVVMIWIIHEVFRLKWHKAVLAWILWIAFVLVFIILFSILGVGIFSFQFFFG